MITFEEARVLAYLQRRPAAPASDVFRSSLPATPPSWWARLIANLEWLGYVTAYYDAAGDPVALHLTEKGRRYRVGVS